MLADSGALISEKKMIFGANRTPGPLFLRILLTNLSKEENKGSPVRFIPQMGAFKQNRGFCVRLDNLHLCGFILFSLCSSKRSQLH